MAEHVQTFIKKWKRAKLTERLSCQEHFLDLCDLLGEMKPAAVLADGFDRTPCCSPVRVFESRGLLLVQPLRSEIKVALTFSRRHIRNADRAFEMHFHRTASSSPPSRIISAI